MNQKEIKKAAAAKTKKIKAQKQLILAEKIQWFHDQVKVSPNSKQMEILLRIRTRQSLNQLVQALRYRKVLKITPKGGARGSDLLVLTSDWRKRI